MISRHLQDRRPGEGLSSILTFLNEKKLDRAMIFILGLIVGVVPLVYLPHPTGERAGIMLDTIYRPKVNALSLLMLVLLLIIFKKERRTGGVFRWERLYLPLVVFLGFALLSTLFSPYRDVALLGREYRCEGFLTYMLYICLLLVAASIIRKWSDTQTLLRMLMVSAGIICLYGLLQYFGIDPIPRDPRRIGWGRRAFSTLGNPNFAGSYVSMVLPLAFGQYLSQRGRTEVFVWGGLSTLFYAMLVATSTRGVWLAMIVLIPLLALFYWNHIVTHYRRLLFIVPLFILITGLLNSYQDGYHSERWQSILSDTEHLVYGTPEARDGVGGSRLFIYRTTLPLLLENPLLGPGPDTFAQVYPQHLWREYRENPHSLLDKAHSEYLQIGATMGLPALASYLWFLVWLALLNVKASKNNLHSKAVMMGVFGYMLQATFNISVVSVAPIFWFLMGLSIALIRMAPPEGPNAIRFWSTSKSP